MSVQPKQYYGGFGNFASNVGGLIFDNNSGLLNRFLDYDLEKRQIKALDSRVNSNGGINGVANQSAPLPTTVKTTTYLIGAVALGLSIALIVKLVK